MTSAAELSSRFAPLTVSHDGDSYVLGRPDLGVYVAVPEPGAVFVQTIQAGGTLGQATDRASAAAGEPVDGKDFLDGLTAAGLLDEVQERTGSSGGRQIRWIEAVSPRAAARLFGRVAWIGYGGAAAAAFLMLLLRPDVRPSWEDAWFLGDPLLSVLAYLPAFLLLAGLHEAWHWLAGRALGVPAVFRVSYRGAFLVFETDLTQIVALPRRRRYGPFLAGMAFDVTVLAIALAARLLYRVDVLPLPALLNRYLGAMVLGQCFAIAWQWLAIFLRSDMYAVLANALRCHNLYRTSWLTMKHRLVALSPAERDELAAASDRDRTVARWFSVVYLASMVAMVWILVTYSLPAAISLMFWLGGNFASLDTGTRAFWESAGVLAYLITLYGLPPLLALRERRMRRHGRLL
jgi:putative peptide zinc metalloprotease protein